MREHLDSAIAAADHKVRDRYDLKQKRRHARTLIAELLREMEPPEWFTAEEDSGWDQAIHDILGRAGIEEYE
jgi:hypothetical protein